MKGRNLSTITSVKFIEAFNFSLDKLAITGTIVWVLLLVQVPLLMFIDRKAVFEPCIHIFCWRMFITCSVPSCSWLFCWFWMINSTARFFQCSNVECFALKSIFALKSFLFCAIDPNKSLFIRKNENCRIFLLFGFSFSIFKIWVSSFRRPTVLIVAAWRLLLSLHLANFDTARRFQN